MKPSTGQAFKAVAISGKCADVDLYNPKFHYSLAIVYIFMAIANVFAPVVVSIFGPTISMFVGGTTVLSVFLL